MREMHMDPSVLLTASKLEASLQLSLMR